MVGTDGVPNKFHKKDPDDVLALNAAGCSATCLFSLHLHNCCSYEGAEAFIPDAIMGISSQHANYVLIPLPAPFAYPGHTFKSTQMAKPPRWPMLVCGN